MPVAVCHLSGAAAGLDPDAMVRDWAARAGCDAGEMSIMLYEAYMGGRSYAALADLALPTLWPPDRARAIARALGEVLCAALKVEPDQVEVHTRWVRSGDVVAGGEILTW